MAWRGGTSARRRGSTAIAAAVVLAALAVTGWAPAGAAAAPQSPAGNCVPGKLVDFCRAVPPADGFRLDKGAYETIAFPGASLTVPYRSNDRGQVVGAYIVPDGTLGGRTHGFVYERGRFRTVDGPRRAPTELFGVNERGQVVGTYQDSGGTTHGLLIDRGVSRRIDGPGSRETVLYSIDNRGRIIGGYVDDGGTVHGLMRDERGRFTTFDAPGATTATGAIDINDRRQIVGIVR